MAKLLETFGGLLESAPDAIVIVDRQGQIVQLNRQVVKLFGYSRSELLGEAVEILTPLRVRQPHVKLREEYAQRPHTRPMGANLDLTGRRKDGSEFPVEISLSPLEAADGRLTVAFIRDVTLRKRLEQERREREMHRAEQLAALGQVAAGVAHELRNPLTSIKGLVQVNLREAESRGLPAEDLRVIEHEIRRMERTLQTFLDFARPPEPCRRQVSLPGVIDRVLSLVTGRAAKQKVAIRFHQPETEVVVDADHDQLQQVLLNLALNALDAMPGGGLLEIVLRAAEDGGVEIQVLDTGPGVPPKLLPKIFEPFVSSKETGLGLGLAVSRRIIEEHAGALSATNRPEGGAIFVVNLPATRMAPKTQLG